MAKCCRTDCTSGKPATHSPVLMMYAPANIPGSNVPACASLTLAVCEDCKARLGPEDFISDEGWAQILDGFVAANKAMPDRTRTKLAWETIAHRKEMFERMERLKRQ